MSLGKTGIAVGGLVGLLCAGAASAQHAGRGHEDGFTPPGLNAAVDNAGKLRALNADEVRTLVAGMARYLDQSSEGLAKVYHPTGAVSVVLDERFQSVSLARVRGDGNVDMRCVGTLDEARDFLSDKAQPVTRQAHAAPVLEEK